MKLLDVVSRVHQLDAELTIYAKPPWCSGSEVSLAPEPDDALVPEPLSSQGFAYFLEIHIAREVVPNPSGLESSATLEAWCARLVRYAENDA